MKNIICLVILLLFIHACSSNDTAQKVSTVGNIQLKNPSTCQLSTIIDSIYFLPLKADFLFGAVPSRLDVDDKYIYYLYAPYSDQTYLLIFERMGGGLIHSISSAKNSKQSIVTIFDIESDAEFLYILHDDKISIYQKGNFEKVRTLLLGEYYNTFKRINSGYLCFESNHGLDIYNEDGILRTSPDVNGSLPLVISDSFDHFTEVGNSGDLVAYFNFIPTLFNISPSGNVDTFISLDLGDDAIGKSNLNNIVRSKNASDLANEQCAKGKFCFFQNVAILGHHIFLRWWMNEKNHYAVIEKSSNSKLKMYCDRIENDTGISFLYEYRSLNYYASNNEYLITSLDAEFVKSNMKKIKPSLPSNVLNINFDECNNPILAFMHFRE